MNDEITRHEWECQLIKSKDGKYFGYDDKDPYERAWHEDPIKAIGWNLKLDSPTKVTSPNHMELDQAILVRVKKTLIIEKIKPEE